MNWVMKFALASCNCGYNFESVLYTYGTYKIPLQQHKVRKAEKQ